RRDAPARSGRRRTNLPVIAHSIEDAPTLQGTAAVAVSIIIPTYNDAPVLGRLLDALPAGRSDVERIVVDGGSSDTTRRIAAAHGVRVIGARRGRGTQMHAGACAANGSVLWFVHPHTAPP